MISADACDGGEITCVYVSVMLVISLHVVVLAVVCGSLQAADGTFECLGTILNNPQ